MSLWPSIKGVALRIRSMRAFTLGSICWAEAGAAMSATVAARRRAVFMAARCRNCRCPMQLRLFFVALPTMRGAMHDLEEVMRFDPEHGLANLDDHLNRLSKAAETQGFKFDRHAARNELQAATFGRRRPA